jgi:uncharacterized protein (TIGR00730 family)
MTKKKNSKDEVAEELKKDDFRVSIFGSARIKPNDDQYKLVYDLAKEIGKHKFDIVTGGGPGLMDAANAGHNAGDKKHVSDNIGLTIELPWEAEENKHLEIKKHFNKFSGRLDTFMALSGVVIVTPGGIGTCLELFYTWQLVQVKHICPIPIILLGKMWEELMTWITKYPLKDGLISPGDTDHIYIAENKEEAMEVIMQAHAKFEKDGCSCHNNHKYKLDE